MPTPKGYSKYKLIISLILSIVFLTTADIYGQDEYFVPKSGQQVLQVCNAIIYDAGGPNNPYDNNWNGSLVLAPISSGNAISIHGTISTCPYDYDSLFIYEGIGTSGTLLLQCCSDWSPYNIPTITANNPQGALTILFKSNNSCTGDGFEIFVECVPDQNVNINPEQFEEQPSCLEFTDLTSPSVTCTWGKHVNGGPFNTYANTGVVTGRHTVIRDTTLYDIANTWGGKISALRCVCPGDTASICLGNSLGASNALGGSESISYEYTVDTSNGGYDLLILKYAAVLEDPNHTAVEQPQFIFQILDENNNLIDPTCGKAEFYAGKNTSTGWQQQGDIYWKDWTHVGIDVSQYHGQTIRIRLSTFDCIYTAHFGYAYFSFGCAKRKITVETCGNVQTNDYGAPEGFTYKWYYSSAPGVTLSTDRVYTAPVYQQNGELLCDVAFIDNPDCKFTLKAVTRPRYPLADFGIDRAGCNYTVFLHDSSATSADQLTPDGSGDHCDNLFWDFGDGNVSQMTNPTAYYTSAGVYNITLIASIANGQCKDTITKTITLYPSHINITGDASICLTKSTTLTITDWGDYIWSTGDTTHSITVSPSQNTTYTVERVDPDSICPSNGSFMVSVQQPQTTYIYDTIFGNTPYYHNGQPFYSAGYNIFYEQTDQNCDSTIFLTLHHQVTIDTSICKGSEYFFDGQHLHTPGTYEQVIHFPQGYDSITILKLGLCDTFFFTSSATICDNKSYQWRDTLLKNLTPGAHVFYDSLKTQNGCDSIFQLILKVNGHNVQTITPSICAGGSYYFSIDGNSYSNAGTYSVFKDLHGQCEQEFKLILTVNPKYNFYDTVTICDNGSYTWRDIEWYPEDADEDIQDLLKTKLNCDSIYHLTLRVSPTYFYQEQATICAGDTLIWHGLSLTKAATYYDSLQTSTGCDSVYQLTLTVNDSYHFTQTHTMCSNDTLKWHGLSLTKTGTYYDSLKTSTGCDSIYTLSLTVNQAYLFTSTDTICENDTMYWHGLAISTAGTYYDSLKTQLNCDSVYEIKIITKHHNVHTTYKTICDGQHYYYPEDGQIYTQNGTYSIFKPMGDICDDEFQLVLTVNPVYNYYDTVTICDNDIYQWRNHTYKELPQGEYQYKDSFATHLGCDSIYHLKLIVLKSYLFTTQDTICENDTLIWHGQALTKAGSYFAMYSAYNGCDSIYQLDLALADTFLIQEYDTICDNDTLIWHGRALTTAGNYYDSLLSKHGCDSIYLLTLTVHDTYFFEEYDTICDGDSRKWHEQTLSATGTYYDSLLSKHGCDSIYQLSLYVQDSYFFQEYDTICDNDTLMWHGQALNSPSTYFAMYNTKAGCDSIYQLNLEIASTYFFQEYDTICDNDTLTWHGQQLTTAGTYHDSLQAAHGCDSVYWITLTVHPTFFFQEYDTICDNDTITWHGQQLTAAGTYHDSLLTSHGCDSVYWLTLTVEPTYFFQEYDTICDNDTITWHGQDLNKPGT